MALRGFQYVQTLEGPVLARKRVQLFGVFDPIVANPLIGLVGLGLGIILGLRSKKRKR